MLAACATFGGLRPRFGPIPGSISIELHTVPDTAIAALTRQVDSAGLAIQLADTAEGYLETRWYDLAARRTVGDRTHDLDGIVKLRFFADPTAGHTRLAAECVRRIAYDPSEPERDLERMVPDSTPGRMLLDSLLAKLKAAYPMPAPAATTTKS